MNDFEINFACRAVDDERSELLPYHIFSFESPPSSPEPTTARTDDVTARTNWDITVAPAEITTDQMRSALKLVRQEGYNAFDVMPNGENIGDFANRQAVLKYRKRIKINRATAKMIRRKKRQAHCLAKNVTSHKKLHAILTPGESL